MVLANVKEKLYDLAAMFFEGATVIWSEQINTKPPLPYVTLKCGGISRTSFPVFDEEDRRIYYAKTILEVNLYTKGNPIKVEDGVTGNYINTATSDLIEFANFIESEEVTNIIATNGMDVTLVSPVRDVTDLQNDSRYRYRAMVEFSVSFAQEANGYYGLGGNPLVPNSSGGGTDEMANKEIDHIEEIELLGGINDEK